MVEENVKLVCGVRPELWDRALDVNKSQPADSLKRLIRAPFKPML